MVIGDLKQPCEACSGSGIIRGVNQYGTLLPKNDIRCQTCQGRGYVLTKLGKEVWELFKPLIEDMLRTSPPRLNHPFPKKNPLTNENQDE